MILSNNRAGKSKAPSRPDSSFPVRKRSGAVADGADDSKRRRLGSRVDEQFVIERGRLKKA